MQKDKIIIRSLKFPVSIGCSEKERSTKQNLEFNIEIYLPLMQAGNTANLTDTVCYHTVCTQIKSISLAKSWVLLEELAETIAREILLEFPLSDSIRIEIRKFIVPDTEYTGIEILRSRK